MLFLDSQHRLIEMQELFRGTLAQTSVYPREVLRQALLLNAGAAILVHNHPSGVAEPSRADEMLTQIPATRVDFADAQNDFLARPANVFRDLVVVDARRFDGALPRPEVPTRRAQKRGVFLVNVVVVEFFAARVESADFFHDGVSSPAHKYRGEATHQTG